MNQIPKNECHECEQRLKAGPHYDRLRGTGRTRHALTLCLIAAQAGMRVLYITHTDQYAKDLRRFSAELLIESGVEVSEVVTMATANRLYFQGGGWLDLRSWSDDLSFRGLKDTHRPQITRDDHHVTHLRLDKAKRERESADLATINQLLAAYGQRAQLVIREGKHTYQLRGQ
jgi:hypothetical protein